jgi:signal transduction histidine kinase
MKDEFVSVVSHELRTPLTSIRGSLGLLASGALPSAEQGERMLDIAITNTDRLIRLVSDFLDLERMTAGRADLDLGATSTAALFEITVEAVRGAADKAGITITVAGPDVPVQVDADRIVQVMVNLVGNAIKFSDEGGEVLLETNARDDEVELRVADRGRGIPLDRIERIFNRFEQVDSSDARDKGGTGLGLAIAKAIVEQHGGRIEVTSTLGEGTTFCVTLPRGAR